MDFRTKNMVRLPEPDLQKLLAHLGKQNEFVFLDTSRPDDENNLSLLFLNPVDRLICRIGDNLSLYLQKLQDRLAEGRHLAGWAGYEFGALLEGKITIDPSLFNGKDQVLADFGVFNKPYIFDHFTGESDLPLRDDSIPEGDYQITNLHSNMDKSEFVGALERVREYIAAGDIYQANYTMKLLFDFEGSPELLYRHLRRNQSVAYGAYIRSGGERLLSFSPELFFRKAGGEITARPMKGTASRGRRGTEESRNGNTLHHDIKNRSENVMIVDLLRNDLARLLHGHGRSEVSVDSLFDVESYESLLQMTSTIKATSSPESMSSLKLTELFNALFPCGSITGAPKIRTMEIIDELEKDLRGVYTGAIGYLGPDGSAVFNVPIRTVRLIGASGEMGVGAGITHDSVPEEEWEESLLKGRFLTHSQPDFTLFETMLWEPDSGYWLLDAHLKRLEQGAEYFKFSFNVDKIHQLLTKEAGQLDGESSRVRLVLEKDGSMTITSSRCAPPVLRQLPEPEVLAQTDHDLPIVGFSDKRVDTSGPWLFHKTTLRELYDNEYKDAQAAGRYETLFCNSDGEVTEGCITNVFIYDGKRYITSPVESGLLPGVMRSRLLQTSSVAVEERAIHREDVDNAKALFVCNSVRGVVRVTLTP